MAENGTTVVRFYPVQPPEWYGGGSPPAIALGRAAFRRYAGDFTAPPLTAVFDGQIYNDYTAHARGPYDPAANNGWGAYEYEDLLTVGMLANVPPGSFTELAFTPCDAAGVLLPIQANELPLVMPVAFPLSDYAGGVFVIGMYLGGEFYELASFQHVSGFFPGDEVPQSDWDALPTPADSLVSGPIEGAPYVRLDANVPLPLFWTSLKQAVEAA